MKTNKEFSIPLRINGSSVRKISLGNCQAQGARPYQEDRFGFSDCTSSHVRKHGFTAIVADGMGGLSKSEIVSGTLVNAFTGAVFNTKSEMPIQRQFSEAINAVNKAVRGRGGGSTIVAVHCSRDGVYWCALGDSRIYLYHNERIFIVTEDMDYKHTLFSDVLKSKMSYKDAAEDPKSGSLAQYIGMPREYSAEYSYIPFVPEAGDKLLLCTDGVYNALTDDEITAALAFSATKSAEILQNLVISKKYTNQDNYTAVVIEFKK